MLITHIKLKDVYRLQKLFAVFTPAGWVIPDWLLMLEKAALPRTYMPKEDTDA